MIAIGTHDLTVSFGGHTVLENITFSVQEGDRVGVIGVNGAGKSTLFRALVGELSPDSGEVFLLRGLRVAMLAQNVRLESHSRTVYDYALEAFSALSALEAEIARTEASLGTLTGDALLSASAALTRLHERFAAEGGATYRARTRSMLVSMGFDEHRQAEDASHLSGGEMTRLALSRILLDAPDVLLLDEPTNHLDLDALTALEEFLLGYKKTVLVISHDRYFLDRVTTRTLQLERARGTLYEGGYSASREKRAQNEAQLEHRYKEQQKEIARIQKNIDFQRRCGQAHNFVTIRAKQKQLSRMEKITLAPPPPKEIRMAFKADGAIANDVLRVRNLSYQFADARERLLSELSFTVTRGERVVLMGKNGCGKSTLMRVLAGKDASNTGIVELGMGVRIGYYDQENRGLCDSHTVFSEMRAAFPLKTDFELRSTLALFLFGAEDMDKSVSLLSGGERARLSLAKLILQPVSLLLLDEPTNHLDVGSREALETAIDAFDGTVVAVSHDRYFIDLLATRIIELDGAASGGYRDYPLETYEGAYDTYVRLKREEEEMRAKAAPAPVQAPSESKKDFDLRKKEKNDARNAERRRARAELRSKEIEQRLDLLDAELFGSAASDYKRAAEIEQEKETLEEELLSLYELLM